MSDATIEQRQNIVPLLYRNKNPSLLCYETFDENIVEDFCNHDYNKENIEPISKPIGIRYRANESYTTSTVSCLTGNLDQLRPRL
ncbi:hypothetical protein LissoIVSPER_00024 [Lissonota sp. PSUC_FEM 10030012]|nr:hypothetical protein [Lissonota sp. PSUC_FEM 10030012]